MSAGPVERGPAVRPTGMPLVFVAPAGTTLERLIALAEEAERRHPLEHSVVLTEAEAQRILYRAPSTTLADLERMGAAIVKTPRAPRRGVTPGGIEWRG